MDDCVDGDCDTGRVCFKHKLASIQWSPSAMPSRKNTVAPRAPQNSWERGIARDERGMPLLGKSGEPVGLHEMASNRGAYESRVRDLKNTPRTPTPTK